MSVAVAVLLAVGFVLGLGAYLLGLPTEEEQEAEQRYSYYERPGVEQRLNPDFEEGADDE